MLEPITVLSDIIERKTLYGLVRLQSDVKKAWDDYIEAIKELFPNTITEIEKTSQDNQDYINDYLAKKIDDRVLVRNLHFNFFDYETLLNKVKDSVDEKLNSIFAINSDNPLIDDFLKTGKGAIGEIIRKLKGNNDYGVDDMVFLLSVYQELFLKQLPLNCETYLSEEPIISIDELGIEWGIAKKKLILGILQAVDITEHALDNELDINKVRASIEGDIKSLVDIIKKVKKSKAPKENKPDVLQSPEYLSLLATSEKQWIAIDELVQLIDELSLKPTVIAIDNSNKPHEGNNIPEENSEEKKKQEEELKKQAELNKYNSLLLEINDPKKNSFKSLPLDFKSQEINSLNNDLLPSNRKKESLTALIKERRATFFYSLDNEEDNGGLSSNDLSKAFELISADKVWKAEDKKPITVEILNELFELSPNEDNKVEDLTDYFISKGGYELSEEVKAEEALYKGENAWMSNGAILRDSLKRINWDPENPTFPAEWPFPTSTGKSTIAPTCLYGCARERENKKQGEGLNIIVVTPTAPACQDLFNHYSTWLQYENREERKPWRCPIHLRDHGGEFPTAKNELTYWDSVDYVEAPSPNDPTKKVLKAQRNRGQGKKGISVMEDKWLEVYLVREVIAINKVKCSIGKEKERIDKGKLAVKAKLINKENTVLIFDESDYARNGTTNFVKLQKLAEELGYKIIRATATFKGKPFSITMPKQGERKYMNGGLLAKYKNNDGNEVNLNANMAQGKTLFFLPKAELNERQLAILERENIGYLVFDETLELASTGLTYGCPNGYVFFGDSRYGRGFTFFINTCISLVEMELKKLTRDWYYNSVIQPISDSELLQQSGRVRRIMEGNFIAVSKRKLTDNDFTKEIDSSDDLASTMTEAVLTGNVDKLANVYPSLVNVGGGARKEPTALLIQSAIALPFSDGKGRYPEEILIGLTKGGAGNDLYPQYGVQKRPPTADKDLWARFEGTYKPKQINPKQAKELLFLMISNLISTQINFPNSIALNFENPLISQAGFLEKDLEKNKQSPNYEKGIEEIRKVVLGAISKKIKDHSQRKYKDEGEFKQVINSLKTVIDNNKIIIEIVREKTDKLKNPKDPSEGRVLKDNLTLRIDYNSQGLSKILKFSGIQEVVPYSE